MCSIDADSIAKELDASTQETLRSNWLQRNITLPTSLRVRSDLAFLNRNV